MLLCAGRICTAGDKGKQIESKRSRWRPLHAPPAAARVSAQAIAGMQTARERMAGISSVPSAWISTLRPGAPGFATGRPRRHGAALAEHGHRGGCQQFVLARDAVAATLPAAPAPRRADHNAGCGTDKVISSASTGVLGVLVMCTCVPLSPLPWRGAPIPPRRLSRSRQRASHRRAGRPWSGCSLLFWLARICSGRPCASAQHGIGNAL